MIVRLASNRRYGFGVSSPSTSALLGATTPSLARASQTQHQTSPITPRKPNAACHEYPAMIETKIGAMIPLPARAPIAITLVGTARWFGGNHLYAACAATG